MKISVIQNHCLDQTSRFRIKKLIIRFGKQKINFVHAHFINSLIVGLNGDQNPHSASSKIAKRKQT